MNRQMLMIIIPHRPEGLKGKNEHLAAIYKIMNYMFYIAAQGVLFDIFQTTKYFITG